MVGFFLTLVDSRLKFENFDISDCNVKVYSGDVFGLGNDNRFKVSNVLEVPNYEDYGNTQWLVSPGQVGNFILNLGCSDESYSAVDLVNVFGYNWSTRRFKVFLR